MSAITLQGIAKRYAGQAALAPTDLAVESGEFMTLLGASGSGKTTLLNIVAGILAPSAGRVLFGGVDVTDRPARERNLGMVFQNYALMPHLSVFENVAFPLRVRRMTRDEVRRRVMETLSLVAMDTYAERKPKALSGGQQQRVSIARCLVYRPPIVLMDEPLGALDKRLRSQLQGEIKRLHRDIGFTALYVTHDQEEALSLSDRICLMDKGSVVQVSPPADIYHRPNTALTADFVGESNLIDATVVAAGPHGSLRLPAGVEVRATVEQAVAGGGVTLLLRPEAVRLLRGDESEGNVLPGTVRYRGFFGDHVRLQVETAGTVLTVRHPSLPEAAVPEPGSRVRVGWAVDHALVLPKRPPP